MLSAGQAQMWFRINRRAWNECVEFKQDFLEIFLHSRYYGRLDENVCPTHITYPAT